MAMTNDKIRTEIAKAKGYIPFPSDKCPVCGFSYSNDSAGCHPNDCSMRPVPARRADESYPNWPEDDAAAMKLWYEIPGYKAIEFLNLSIDSHRHRITIKDGLAMATIYGPTLAIAVCLAWLLWYQTITNHKGAKS